MMYTDTIDMTGVKGKTLCKITNVFPTTMHMYYNILLKARTNTFDWLIARVYMLSYLLIRPTVATQLVRYRHSFSSI
jgi:hypothetical protein